MNNEHQHGERRNHRWERTELSQTRSISTTVCDRFCGKCNKWIDTSKEELLEVALNCPKCKTRW